MLKHLPFRAPAEHLPLSTHAQSLTAGASTSRQWSRRGRPEPEVGPAASSRAAVAAGAESLQEGDGLRSNRRPARCDRGRRPSLSGRVGALAFLNAAPAHYSLNTNIFSPLCCVGVATLLRACLFRRPVAENSPDPLPKRGSLTYMSRL